MKKIYEYKYEEEIRGNVCMAVFYVLVLKVALKS